MATASAARPAAARHPVYVGLVGVESMGVPVPGETALITAGVLARSGQFNITAVIAVAAGAAIIGDRRTLNAGYSTPAAIGIAMAL